MFEAWFSVVGVFFCLGFGFGVVAFSCGFFLNNLQ